MAGSFALNDTDTGGVILFGLLMGALHVLMGADHLCALAVVAAPGESDLRPDRARGARTPPNDSEDDSSVPSDASSAGHRSDFIKTFLKSSALGIRWGLGHAAGLALVCAAFFSAKGAVSLDGVGDVTDKVVGASMVVLGVVALVQLRAWRKRRALERAHLDDALVNAAADLQPHAEGRRMDLEAKTRDKSAGSITKEPVSTTFAPLTVSPGSAAHAHAHDLDLPHVHRVGTEDGAAFSAHLDAETRTPPKDADVELGVSLRADASSTRASGERNENESPATQRAGWSFAIGFSHGVASPSGILSVLPAVVLDDSAKASAYLVAFFLTSTASMAAFAGAFGLVAAAAAAAAAAAPTRDPARRISDAPARVAMGLNLFAGAAAIAIGVAWLALSATGKLGDL